MQLLLRIANGPSSGKKLLLRPGQLASVGRTEWADFCVPDDDSLAEFHFTVRAAIDGCQVSDHDANGVELDGVPVSLSKLTTGQKLRAGGTTFEVTLLGEPVDAGCSSAPNAAINGDQSDCCGGEQTLIGAPRDEDETPSAQPQPQTSAEFAVALELSDDTTAILEVLPDDNPFSLLEMLVQRELYADAICLSAGMMHKQAAVRWGVDCLQATQTSRPEQEQHAIDAAEAWLQEPTEVHRRAAEAAAQCEGLEAAGSWLAMAVFWSEGSIAPADQPPVEAPWHLTAKGIVASLMLDATANVTEPSQATARYQRYLSMANHCLNAMAGA